MAPTPTPAEATDAEEEVLLLAALDALPPLDYARPADRTNQAWMRQFGPVRSGGAAALIDARAPADHAGLTLDDSPRLWWSLSDATDAPIEVTVVDEEALDPLLRVSLPGPHAAGLHSIDLGAHGVELEPGVEYRWFATVVLDPDRPSRNPISVGSLEVVERDSSLRDEVGPEDDPTRGHRLASLGLWYDAFDFYATLAERHPSIERLARERDRLSSLAGDAEAAAP
jgi:hypothetical protein